MLRKILILLIAVKVIRCGIFDVNPLYFKDKPICQEINSTLYKHVQKILQNLNETAEVNPRAKRSLVEKNYNFKIISTHNFDVQLNISSIYTIDSSSNFTSIIKDQPIYNLLPLNYSIEETSIENVNESVIWISGTRCKWECDKVSKNCQHVSCWSNPSLCLGDIDTCVKNDGDGSCFKDSDSSKKVEYKNKFTFTNLDLGKYIFKNFNFKNFGYHINEDGTVMLTAPHMFHWNCTSQVVDHMTENVTCYNDYTWAAPSHAFLKTLAG